MKIKIYLEQLKIQLEPRQSKSTFIIICKAAATRIMTNRSVSKSDLGDAKNDKIQHAKMTISAINKSICIL